MSKKSGKKKSGNPALQAPPVNTAPKPVVGLASLSPETMEGLNLITVRIRDHVAKKKNETAFVLRMTEVSQTLSGDDSADDAARGKIALSVMNEIFGPFNAELATLLPTMDLYTAFITDAIERDTFRIGLKK